MNIITNQFTFKSTQVKNVILIDKSKYQDDRGTFIKSYNSDAFKQAGLNVEFQESYYSTSKKNVLRGMHYQKNPHAHAKLVQVVEGEILDVVVCVDSNLPDNVVGEVYSTILSKDNNQSLYIPKGFAHGFLVLSDFAVVVNHMTSGFSAEHDAGIKYDSFGFNWPSRNLILSEKDRAQIPLTKLVQKD